MSVTRIILMVIIVPLTVQLFSGRYGRILPVDWLFFLYIGWMTLSMSVVSPDRVIENTGSAAIEFLGAYLVGRAFIRSRDDLILLTKLVVAVVICTLPLALLETATGQPLILNLIQGLPGLSSYANVNNATRMGLERVQTVFYHPIHYGLFCSMSFGLIYVGLAHVVTMRTRWLCAAALSLGVFLSLSSGALLALLLQIFLIGWSVMFRNVEKRWLVLLCVFAVMYVFLDITSNRSPIRVFMSYATFSAHNAYWRSIIFEWGVMNIMGNAAEGIPAAKLFGIGLSDWVRPSYMHSGSMDNFWLVVAVRNGLPAFAALAGGYVWVLWKVGRRDLGGDPVLLDLRRAWMISFAGLTFTLATVHIWGSIFSFVFFMFGAGVWFVTAEPEARGDTPEPAPEVPDRSRESYTRFPRGPSGSPTGSGRRPAPARPARPVAASSRDLRGPPAVTPGGSRR